MKDDLLRKVGILYEDQEYLVINKPSGLMVHADGRRAPTSKEEGSDPRLEDIEKESTLVDWILEKYPHTKNVGEPLRVDSRFKIHDLGNEKKKENKDSILESSIMLARRSHSEGGYPESTIIYRPGIVHRIDKETSGVLLIAKSQPAYQRAKEQFQNHTVIKIYNAFLYGEIKGDEGVINRAIGRSKNDFRKWTAQRGARGEMREAITNYTVLKKAIGFSYIEARPVTGRTHQIRVHFKAINHPVVSDKLYAENKEPALGFTRLALHAKSIEFSLMSSKRLKIEAPLPPDFAEALTFF